MSKRGAVHQITKDDYDADAGEEEEEGVWRQASEDKLAARTFVKVKRKEKAPTAALPAFSFGTPAPVADAPVVNAFAKLVKKSNWECPSCMLSNKVEVKKCPACEEINPNLSPDEVAKLKASSGTASVAGAFGSSSSTGTSFSFGSSSGTGTGFSFGTDAAAAGSGFTFGGAAATGTGLTFGAVAGSGWPSGDSDKDATTGFSFDSSTSATFMGQTDGPKEEFKDKKQEATGEESDVLLLKKPAKCYTLKEVEVAEEGEGAAEGGQQKVTKFVESGTGDLHINQYDKDGKKRARMVLRVEKTQRLVLNAPIFEGMAKELQGDKFIRFTSLDLDQVLAVYLLKFKSKLDATAVYQQIEQSLKDLK